jgi:hypothetical protein
MTMKLRTPARCTLSTQVASMPYLPSGVMSAELETAQRHCVHALDWESGGTPRGAQQARLRQALRR